MGGEVCDVKVSDVGYCKARVRINLGRKRALSLRESAKEFVGLFWNGQDC
jgi:hypothetical protein